MLTLNPSPARPDRLRKRRKTPAATPPARVRELLQEIAFALHATRVVGRRDRAVAPKKG